MQNDLTQGNVAQKIIVFSIPILLSNLFQQLFSIADSTIVGRMLGKEALAAVGASYQINCIILAVAMGLTLGMGILISDAYGARQNDMIQRIVDTGFLVCVALAVVITVLGIIFAENILMLFNVPKSIMVEATLYFRIICIGTIISFAYNAITNYLRGIGDSRAEFYFLVVSSVVNIILDFLLVKITRSVAGAAIATVVSQTIAFGCMFFYANRKRNVFQIRFKHLEFDYGLLKKGLKIGIPAMLQQLFIGVGNSIIQGMINSYGAVIIAAYTAASKIDGIAVMPALNIGKAMSNYIAQNKGAGEEKRVKSGMKVGIVLVMAISVFFSIVIFAASNVLLRLFCEDSQVCLEGMRYLQIICVFYVFFGCMQCLNGILLGLGKSNLSLIGSIVSFCIFQVPLAVILSKSIGIVGIWLAAPLGWIAGMVIRILFVVRCNK